MVVVAIFALHIKAHIMYACTGLTSAAKRSIFVSYSALNEMLKLQVSILSVTQDLGGVQGFSGRPPLGSE